VRGSAEAKEQADDRVDALPPPPMPVRRPTMHIERSPCPVTTTRGPTQTRRGKRCARAQRKRKQLASSSMAQLRNEDRRAARPTRRQQRARHAVYPAASPSTMNVSHILRYSFMRRRALKAEPTMTRVDTPLNMSVLTSRAYRLLPARHAPMPDAMRHYPPDHAGATYGLPAVAVLRRAENGTYASVVI